MDSVNWCGAGGKTLEVISATVENVSGQRGTHLNRAVSCEIRSPWAAEHRWSNTRGSVARAVESQEEPVRTSAGNPRVNAPCVPRGVLFLDWQRIAELAASLRQFESRKLQLNDSALLIGSRNLVCLKPYLKDLIADGGAGPKYVCLEHQLRPHGVEHREGAAT